MRKEKEKKIDGTLLVTVWILLGLGLVILYSASAYNGRVRFHDPAYYFKKQLFASALGVIGMYAVAKTRLPAAVCTGTVVLCGFPCALDGGALFRK